jgi:hypothetical protein
MGKLKLLQQHQNREFFAHHMLLHAAELQLQSAKQSEVGCFNHCLAAMTMTSLAVEALVNAVGSRTVEDWRTFERLKPLEKIEQLQTKLGFPSEPTQTPWSTLRDLGDFRNDIAHAKPEAVNEMKRFAESDANKHLLDKPLSELERKITCGNANRYLKAVQKLKEILTDAMPAELRFGIYADAWSGSTGNAE